MVLFFRGDFSFCFADSLSCRMAASATGSVPFSTSSSEKKGLFQRGEGKTGKNRAQTGGVCLWLKIHRNGINTINIFQFTTRPSGLVFPLLSPIFGEKVLKWHLQPLSTRTKEVLEAWTKHPIISVHCYPVVTVGTSWVITVMKNHSSNMAQGWHMTLLPQVVFLLFGSFSRQSPSPFPDLLWQWDRMGKAKWLPPSCQFHLLFPSNHCTGI